MSFRRYILAAVALLAIAAPSAAAAQGSPPVTLETAGTQPFEGGAVSLARQRVTALARVAGAAPGSTLTLTFVHRGATVRTVRAAADAAGNAEATSFVTPALGGQLSIRARLGVAPAAGARRTRAIPPRPECGS